MAFYPYWKLFPIPFVGGGLFYFSLQIWQLPRYICTSCIFWPYIRALTFYIFSKSAVKVSAGTRSRRTKDMRRSRPAFCACILLHLPLDRPPKPHTLPHLKQKILYKCTITHHSKEDQSWTNSQLCLNETETGGSAMLKSCPAQIREGPDTGRSTRKPERSCRTGHRGKQRTDAAWSYRKGCNQRRFAGGGMKIEVESWKKRDACVDCAHRGEGLVLVREYGNKICETFMYHSSSPYINNNLTGGGNIPIAMLGIVPPGIISIS